MAGRAQPGTDTQGHQVSMTGRSSWRCAHRRGFRAERDGGPRASRGHLQRHSFPPRMRSTEARDHTHRHVHTLVHANTHRHTRAHTHTELGALLRFQSPPSGRDGDRLVCRAATATGTAGRHQTPSPGQGTCGPRLTWARALRAALAAPAPAKVFSLIRSNLQQHGWTQTLS